MSKFHPPSASGVHACSIPTVVPPQCCQVGGARQAVLSILSGRWMLLIKCMMGEGGNPIHRLRPK